MATTAATTTPLTGSCACKTIRYHLTAPPLFTHCCHCTACQRETGTAFAINALIESSDLQILSPTVPVAVIVPSDSGLGQTILRCPSCYTPMWSHYGGGGLDVAFVRVGSLDEPAAVKPDIHIYTKSKVEWLVLPEGVPAVNEYYDNKKYWSADSLARRAKQKAGAGAEAVPGTVA
jgi:hypothetical protein